MSKRFTEFKINYSGVAQWLACWAHNPKVRGSKPRSAIIRFMLRPGDAEHNIIASNQRATPSHHKWALSAPFLSSETQTMTPAGLEPAIPGSVGRCLIHWATGPIASLSDLHSHSSLTNRRSQIDSSRLQSHSSSTKRYSPIDSTQRLGTRRIRHTRHRGIAAALTGRCANACEAIIVVCQVL